MRRPLLFMGALLIRYVAGCGDDESDDPRFTPFLQSGVTLDAVQAADDRDRAIDVVVVAEMRRATYECTEDTGPGSCSPSQDPDHSCSGEPPDFGPHWGEVGISEVPITSVTAELCASDRTCTRYEAKLIDESEGSCYSEENAYGATGDAQRWRRTYRVVVPNVPGDACPSIHVTYGDGTAPAIFDIGARCVVATPPSRDGGADAPSTDAGTDESARKGTPDDARPSGK